MSVPPDIMALQNQGQPAPQQMGGMPPAADAGGGPAAAPAAGPTGQEGNKLMAETNVQTAVTMLMAALPAYAPGTEECNDLLDCLKKLSRRFGAQPAKALVPAQVMELQRQVQSGQPAVPPGAAQ